VEIKVGSSCLKVFRSDCQEQCSGEIPMEVFWKPKKYTAQSVHGHISQIKYERSLKIGLRENNGTYRNR
jgi:hypothetical protein